MSAASAIDTPEQTAAAPLWELRWHPFRGEWVLYTAHRSGRPWLGERKSVSTAAAPAYDPNCALCPRNTRLSGQTNPDYTQPYAFTNDLPPFGGPTEVSSPDDLYRARPATGTAEVVCYHPNHSKTMADLTVAEVESVVELWTERYQVLGAHDDVDHVLIFENKGELVGTSNPHPHCQIYAGSLVYGFIARETEMARAHFQKTGEPIGLAVAQREQKGPRVVCANAHFLACVPWFARYAYEVHILPIEPATSLADLDSVRQKALAEVLREVTIRYDNLWEMPMPYVMAIHQAPTDGGDHAAFPFHIEFHPPLRKPDTLKYLAGPEIGGGSMTNESDPDAKAAELRAVSSQLYRTRTEAAW
ncbi:MAG: galactose-1-phosphate uridylyltransferase [Opitutales bacterium]